MESKSEQKGSEEKPVNSQMQRASDGTVIAFHTGFILFLQFVIIYAYCT